MKYNTTQTLFELSIRLIMAVAMLSVPLLATTVQKMDLAELITASDSILQGRVESIEARYEDKMIYTYISVTVDDPIKGGRRRSVLVRQPGGRIGAKMTWIAGMPQFNRGDQVIVFLRDRQDGTFDVTGLNQGKYDVVNDFIIRNVSGVTILDPKTGLMSDTGFVEKTALDAFKTKIRELMK
jgi:hypothetical protein